jgi:hypothetical protein
MKWLRTLQELQRPVAKLREAVAEEQNQVEAAAAEEAEILIVHGITCHIRMVSAHNPETSLAVVVIYVPHTVLLRM